MAATPHLFAVTLDCPDPAKLAAMTMKAVTDPLLGTRVHYRTTTSTNVMQTSKALAPRYAWNRSGHAAAR